MGRLFVNHTGHQQSVEDRRVMMTRLQARMTDKAGQVWIETGCAAGWIEMARVEALRLPATPARSPPAKEALAQTDVGREEQGNALKQHADGVSSTLQTRRCETAVAEG